MDMIKKYKIAGHSFEIVGENLCKSVSLIEGFKVFEDLDSKTSFSFLEGMHQEVPDVETVQYTFRYEDVVGTFSRTSIGYRLCLKPCEDSSLDLWCREDDNKVFLAGNLSLHLLRFALWIGYGLMTLKMCTLAIHSSCIVYQDKAVLFLGESGTGKSTHTRLWQECIDGAFLLNDDSPVIRCEEGKIWAYGCAWSGKTPCYKNQRFELKACVRLSQAPFNQMQKLSILQAYGAIHPSCAPEFAYDTILYDGVSQMIGKILSVVPCYHLKCLPNKEAAMLSCQTIFDEKG